MLGFPPRLSPRPELWGSPVARFDFSDGACPARLLGPQRIEISLTFCGVLGEAVWGEGASDKGGMGTKASERTTCDAFVRGNPTEFLEAFWQINYVRVYQRTYEGPGGR